MQYMIRDDIISLDTFVQLRVYFDQYIRVIHDSGGYAFSLQIEELWKAHGGKNLISKMVAAKVIKLSKFNQRTFVYVTEATLKYIKYADSETQYDGVTKNLLSVDTLSPSPSHKKLIASALKFSLLAPGIYFDQYVRVILNSGGYAFSLQIEELWKEHGGENLITKMVAAKVIKLSKFDQQTFVYVTEVAIKHLKYVYSEMQYDGVAKNLLSVDTLSPSPSHEKLIASTLKFNLLAPSIDNNIVTPVGKTDYQNHVKSIVTRYMRRRFPDYETDIPKMGGTLLSDYKAYKKLFSPIINSLEGFYDSTKCVILPYVVKVRGEFKLNLLFCIFDTGLEKTARDYAVIAYKVLNLFTQLSNNNVTFMCYTYSEGRRQSLLNDLRGYFGDPENLKRLKEQKGWYAISVNKFEFEDADFIIDPIMEKIMDGNLMTKAQRQLPEMPKGLDLKARNVVKKIAT